MNFCYIKEVILEATVRKYNKIAYKLSKSQYLHKL